MTCRFKACAFSTTDGLSAPGCNHTVEMPSSLHSSNAAKPAASGTQNLPQLVQQEVQKD